MQGIRMKRPGALVLGILVLTVGSHGAWGEDHSIGTAESADAAEIPVDPVVEEPLRSLGTDGLDISPNPVRAECGAMNALALPLGVLFASGLGWIPRGRARCTVRDTDRSSPRQSPSL